MILYSLACLAWCLPSIFATGQDRALNSVAYGATAQERLLMEQIDQLASAGQISEALTNLKRLVDQSQGRMIEAGSVERAATLSMQLHIPIAQWAQWRLAHWSKQFKDQLESVARSDEELAARSLESISQELSLQALDELIKRYSLTPSATQTRLTLCDLYLDRGWTIAARQAIEGPGMSWRALPQEPTDLKPGVGVPWASAWSHVRSTKGSNLMLDQSWRAIDAPFGKSTDALRLALLNRILSIAACDASESEIRDLSEWAKTIGERLSAPEQAQLVAGTAQAQQWFEQRQKRQQQSSLRDETFAADNARSGNSPATNDAKVEIASWPKWTKAMERLTGQSDRNPASKPPVAEGSLGILPYYPVVHDGKVFVHELTRITAYDASNGKSWPPTEPAMPLYDTGTTMATYFPFGYNLVGAPRGTLTIDDDRLYARMGPPVTGWVGKPPTNEHMSLSSLIALDLNRQGSMRPGFPVRLSFDEFPHAEFEGAPTIVGQQVLACVLARDNVNLRRFVISIDRDTGSVQWRSPVLASGMVSGCEQASLVSHQLLSVAGGRIFVNTNLGAIACLNLTNGEIVWLARYQRAPAATDEPYARPDRYRYRDLTPCMVLGWQLICAPQDCPELFALDTASGQLLWSTDAERVDDANQLLGTSQQNVIVAGDRIYWLEAQSGKVLAAFPAGGVGEVAAALPSPRGYGRGFVSGGRVYWPTSSEIFVFDAQQSSDSPGRSPVIRERIRLDTRGAEGGNLFRFGDRLIIAGPGRMFVF